MKYTDIFYRLPDEIIVSHILPKLELKDAIRCGTLSRRWQKLWDYNSTSKLRFSLSPHCDNCPRSLDIKELRSFFINVITRVLEAYTKPTLEELTVCFDFDYTSTRDIHQWVKYAFQRRVARLELDFSPNGNGAVTCRWENYNYSLPFRNDLKALLTSAGGHNNLIKKARYPALYNLRELCLKHVNITTQAINLLLYNCPSLERLCLYSLIIDRLYIENQSFKLKSLELVDIHVSPISLSLWSPSLLSLRYQCLNAPIISHAPLLSELHFTMGLSSFSLQTRSFNFGYVLQVKTLKLDITDFNVYCIEPTYPIDVPHLPKLEQLEVNIRAPIERDSCLLWPVLLIKAAPSLHRFSIKIMNLQDSIHTDSLVEAADKWTKLQSLHQANVAQHYSEIRLKAKQFHHHQCLKLVAIHGFHGWPCELELAECLLGASESLQKIVVVPNLPNEKCGKCGDDIKAKNVKKNYKEFGEGLVKLTGWVPKGVYLVVA